MRIDDTSSGSDITSRVCLDHSRCSVAPGIAHPILTINKGARVFSNTRHLTNLPAFPTDNMKKHLQKHASVIQYTAKKRIRLIVCNRNTKNNDSVYLRHLVTRKQALSDSDKKRATGICAKNSADGWFVRGDEKRQTTESLVLLFPKQVLL